MLFSNFLASNSYGVCPTSILLVLRPRFGLAGDFPHHQFNSFRKTRQCEVRIGDRAHMARVSRADSLYRQPANSPSQKGIIGPNASSFCIGTAGAARRGDHQSLASWRPKHLCYPSPRRRYTRWLRALHKDKGYFTGLRSTYNALSSYWWLDNRPYVTPNCPANSRESRPASGGSWWLPSPGSPGSPSEDQLANGSSRGELPILDVSLASTGSPRISVGLRSFGPPNRLSLLVLALDRPWRRHMTTATGWQLTAGARSVNGQRGFIRVPPDALTQKAREALASQTAARHVCCRDTDATLPPPG